MKSFAGSLLLWSSSLLACPHLAGTYSTCIQDDFKNKAGEAVGGRVHNLVIEQSKTDEKDSYRFRYKDNDEVTRPYGLVIDGKTTTKEKFDRWSRTDVKHELTAKCEGNSLLIKSRIWHSEKLFSETQEVLTKQEKTLSHAITGTTNGQVINVKLECQP